MIAGSGRRVQGAKTDLVEVPKQIRGIVVDAVRPRGLEFVTAVAAREQPHAERPRAARRQQIPDAVPHHDAALRRHAEAARRKQEEVRIGLGARDVVSSDHRRALGHAQRAERPTRRGRAAARRDRPRHPAAGQRLEQVDGPGQRPHPVRELRVGPLVILLHGLELGGRQAVAELAGERVHEQPAAHPDTAVDAPDGQRDPRALERGVPGDHVVVNAVDERPIEIEHERDLLFRSVARSPARGHRCLPVSRQPRDATSRAVGAALCQPNARGERAIPPSMKELPSRPKRYVGSDGEDASRHPSAVNAVLEGVWRHVPKPDRTNAGMWAIGAGHAMTHAYSAAFFVLLPFLARDLGLSYSQVGLIIAVRQLMSTLVNLPAGVIVDTLGRRTLFMSLALAWAALPYLLIAATSSYRLILVCIGLVGIGNFLWHPAAITSISAMYPTRRGYGLALHELGANLGDTLTPLAAGLLLAALTWRSVLVVPVAAGLLLTLVIMRMMDRVQRQRGEPFHPA